GSIGGDAADERVVLDEIEIPLAIEGERRGIVRGHERGDCAARIGLADARGFGDVEIPRAVAREAGGAAEHRVVRSTAIADEAGDIRACEAGESGGEQRLAVRYGMQAEQNRADLLWHGPSTGKMDAEAIRV